MLRRRAVGIDRRDAEEKWNRRAAGEIRAARLCFENGRYTREGD
jgi:hypothetical protein